MSLLRFSWPLLILFTLGDFAAQAAIRPASQAVRLRMIEVAQTLTPVNRAGRSISQGPAQKDLELSGLPTVNCRFIEPDLQDPPGGKTPKFECATRIQGRDLKLRIKYQTDREKNPGIWGELLSSRLFWALGFPADAMYPVRVVCENCPDRPFDFIRDFVERKGRISPRPRGRLEIEDAVAEIKFDAPKIEITDRQGWTWAEFDRIDRGMFATLKPQRDALALLAAFVQHADNKPEQQRLICVDPGAQKNGTTCRMTALMINDLGFTFGQGFDGTPREAPQAVRERSRLLGTASLQGFRVSPLWLDPRQCITDIRSFETGAKDGSANKRISEAGRAMLAARLAALTDADITDLFRVARIERRGELIGGAPPTVQQWVDAFKTRRRVIESTRCPLN